MNQYRVVLSLLSQKSAQLRGITDIDLDFIGLISKISPGSMLVGDVFHPKILLQNLVIEYDLAYPISCYVNALLIVLPFLRIKIVLRGTTNLCSKSLVGEGMEIKTDKKCDGRKKEGNKHKEAIEGKLLNRKTCRNSTNVKNVRTTAPEVGFDENVAKKCKNFDRSIDSLPIKLDVMKLFGAEIKHKILKRGFNSSEGRLELVNEQALERLKSVKQTDTSRKRINTLIVASHLSDFLPKSIRSQVKKNIPDARIDIDRNKDSETVGLQVMMYCKYFYYETYEIDHSEKWCEEMMKYIFERIISDDVFDSKLTDLIFVCMSLATGVSQAKIHDFDSIASLVKTFYPVEVLEKDGIASVMGVDYCNVWQ